MFSRTLQYLGASLQQERQERQEMSKCVQNP